MKMSYKLQNLGTKLSYIEVGDSSESDGGDVEGVCDEVHDVPHVADVLLEADVPQLLDLRPDEAGHLQ